MSWFDAAGFASLARSALNTAQRTIDKALDIKDDLPSAAVINKSHDGDSFFALFGLEDQPASSSGEAASGETDICFDGNQSVDTGTRSVPQTPLLGVSQQSELPEPRTSSSLTQVAQVSGPRNDPNPVELVCLTQPSAMTVLQQPQRAEVFPLRPEACSGGGILHEVSQTMQHVERTLELTRETEEWSSSLSRLHDNVFPQELHSSQASDGSSDTVVGTSITDDSDSQSSLGVRFTCAEPSEEVRGRENSNSVTFSEESLLVENWQSLETNISDRRERSDETRTSVNVQDICSRTDLTSVNMEFTTREANLDIGDTVQEVGNQEQYAGSQNSTPPTEQVTPSSDSIQMLSSRNSSDLTNPSTPDKFFQQSELAPLHLSADWNWTSASQGCILVASPSEDGAHIRQADVSPESIVCISENQMSGCLSPTAENINQSCKLAHGLWTESSLLSIDSTTWSLHDATSQLPDDGNVGEDRSESTETNDGIEDAENKELREVEVKSSDSCGSGTTNSSSSFVKCSAEDADSCSPCIQSPYSGTVSERSDNTKAESEQNSGHTSGDEIETATSSDIEIISPNGDNGERHGMSPMKHTWTSRPHRHRRSESPASDSSKDSMMPVVREVDEEVIQRSSRHGDDLLLLGPHRFSRHDENYDIDGLLRQLGELREVVDARERKVLQLSKENMEYHEANNQLLSQLHSVKESSMKQNRDASGLTQEFTQQIAELENQVQLLKQERDVLKNQLHLAQQEVAVRPSATEMERVVKEKDQQITELLHEGEKLSKQQLQHSNIIKKLRAKEKENETTLKSLREKTDDQAKEVDRLRKSLGAKDDQEKKHIEAIRQLTMSVQKQEKEITALKDSLEDANEKVRSFQNVLDGAYREITDLKMAAVEKDSVLEEATLSAKVAARQDMVQELDRLQQEADMEKRALLVQLDDLRSTFLQSEQHAHLREEMLRADVASLQKTLRDAESRNEELTQSVSVASRPLLRQIETLQASVSSQSTSWEKVEKNLLEQLNDVTSRLNLATQRERILSEKYLEANSRGSAAEVENSTLRQEKLRLTTQLELLQEKVLALEAALLRESNHSQTIKQNFALEITHLKKEKDVLEAKLRLESEQLQTERRTAEILREQLKDKEWRTGMSESSKHTSPSQSPPGSRLSSVSDFSSSFIQDDALEAGLCAAGGGRMSLYDSLRGTNATTLVESLQSQLKQREGEISQLQMEVGQMERVRESLVAELGYQTRRNDQLEVETSNLGVLEQSFKEMEQKYNTLLQMYGEKVEEAEELRLDLDDVKAMYRAQIDELMEKR